MLFPVLCRDCTNTVPDQFFTSTIHSHNTLCESCCDKYDEAHDEMFYSLEEDE